MIEQQEEAEKPKSKRMTGEQWTDCKIKWSSGQYTLSDLSALYGVSRNGIHRRLTRHNIKKGVDAEAYESQAREKQIEEASDAAAERDARIRSKGLESEEFLLNAVDVVTKQGLRAIVEAKKAGNPISFAMDDVKTAKEAILMFKAGIESIKKIVGEKEVEEDDLPSLSVTGLTTADMEEIRREQAEQDKLFGEVGDEEDLDGLDELDED